MSNELMYIFRINAAHMHGEACLDASMRVATVEEAREIAALFPKSARVQGTTLSGVQDEDGNYITIGLVTFRVSFTKDGVTGSFNETGLKRYRSFRRNINNFDFHSTWAAPYANSFQTEADFENYLTQEA